ncbi:MAG: transposase [Verrucomicrobiales bacterium]
MFSLSEPWAGIIQSFAPLFSVPSWSHAQILLLGSILAPGKRTVTSVLKVLGLGSCFNYQRYHRVLNRNKWSSYQSAKILLNLLIKAFVPSGPLVFGLDETIERRWGKKIKQRGIYRDAARSSKSVTNQTSGLRWLSVQLLASVPFAKKVWALPFLTLLCPSERYYQAKGRPHKKLTVMARQTINLVTRWCPKRPLVFVGDSAYAALELFSSCQRCGAVLIAPIRWDANFFDPAPPLTSKPRTGRPPVKGKTQPKLKVRLLDKKTLWKTHVIHWHGKGKTKVQLATGISVWYHTDFCPVALRWVIVRDPLGRFETKALACTYEELGAKEIVEYYTRRWQVEVTFQEMRAHLGLETQRQWNPKAIERTTPALFSLFSLVTLLCAKTSTKFEARSTAWYAKSQITFSDALAFVREKLWEQRFQTSHLANDVGKPMHDALKHFAGLLCYAS